MQQSADRASESQEATVHGVTQEQRFQILLAEMNLLQGRFDKYDQLMFTERGWLVTIIVAVLGAALTLKLRSLAALSASIPALFYILEVLWRSGYWHKYVTRYRYIRDTLNEGQSLDTISLYDLTHHYGDPSTKWNAIRASAFRTEPIVFFGSLVLSSLVVLLLI